MFMKLFIPLKVDFFITANTPQFQKSYRHRPDTVTLQADTGILPYTESLYQISVLICYIKSTCVGNLSIDNNDFLMISEVHKQFAGIFMDGIENFHLESFFSQIRCKIFSRTQ